MAATYAREWFKQAPVLIVVFGKHEEAWKRPADGKDHTDIDIAIAVDHMTLKAAEMGLGTCWICNFDIPKVKTLFSGSDTSEPIAILTLGYPVDTPAIDKKRKAMNEVFSYNKL